MKKTIVMCNLMILLLAFEVFSNENKTINIPFMNVTAGKGICSVGIPIKWQTTKKNDFHFQIFRGLTDDWHDADLLADNVIGNAYTDSSAKDFGRLYYYWIRAYDQSGMSFVSQPVQGYLEFIPPKNVRASEGVYIDKILFPPIIDKNVKFEVWRNDSSGSKK